MPFEDDLNDCFGLADQDVDVERIRFGNRRRTFIACGRRNRDCDKATCRTNPALIICRMTLTSPAKKLWRVYGLTARRTESNRVHIRFASRNCYLLFNSLASVLLHGRLQLEWIRSTACTFNRITVSTTRAYNMSHSKSVLAASLCLAALWTATTTFASDDFVRDLQTRAIEQGRSPLAHWGPKSDNYTFWKTHTNRLIPVYTFGTRVAENTSRNGINLDSYTGVNSAYRSADALRRIYGKVPANTLNPQADYLDQTDLASLQRAAFAGGKKYVFLVIFDGMDWQTTWAASIFNMRGVAYRSGRGTGTHFQRYTAAGTTQFACMVTSPHNDGTKTNVDEQRVLNAGGAQPGGYNVRKMGPNPWTPGDDPFYPMGKSNVDPAALGEHAYTDSAASATAMCSGVKSYNDAINVDANGNQVSTIAHEMQAQGFAIGVVTSVPISHATPACAYAHNVHRDDYQDLTRDLVGLRSIAHPEKALAGVDVLIGGGAGDIMQSDSKGTQGKNFVPGNAWITEVDMKAIDSATGGKYLLAVRTPGINARNQLGERARDAAQTGKRLFGFYGQFKGHLPFQTADGDYRPTIGNFKLAEAYSQADLDENPKLADMTSAALTVLEKNPKGFWLMVEAGDVDWANHDNNLDNSIGAVNSGDAAVKTITDWVEQHSNWNESLLIVTADHGHYLVLERPELLTGTKRGDAE
jgi:alkaline phosphatase